MYSQYFEIAQRKHNCTNFIRKTENAPKELQDFIYEIHQNAGFDCLPNDWIYRFLKEAMEEIEELGIMYEESYTPLSCVEPDIYNIDLIEWLKEPYALEYCNEALELGITKGKDIIRMIGCGQYLMKDRIVTLIYEFYAQNKDKDS